MVIQERLYTVDELWELVVANENTEYTYELVEGRIVEMPRLGGVHGELVIWLGHLITNFMENHPNKPLGKLTTETGYHPTDDRGNLLSPDLAFIPTAKIAKPFPEKFVPAMPDLAVEIMSPNDRPRAIKDKVMRYAQLGTSLIWVLDPHERTADVYTVQADGSLRYQFVDHDGTLDGGDVLPGLTLPLTTIFRD